MHGPMGQHGDNWCCGCLNAACLVIPTGVVKVEQRRDLCEAFALDPGPSCIGRHCCARMHVLLTHRGGASYVTAVESVRHMADTANKVVSLNNQASCSIDVVHKDARYLDTTNTTPADVAVFEVRESGRERRKNVLFLNGWQRVLARQEQEMDRREGTNTDVICFFRGGVSNAGVCSCHERLEMFLMHV